MKFRKIVGFGDSWMWGDELLDPALVDHEYAHPVLIENTEYREKHCFLGLLGTHYGLPTENFGWPGGSLQSMIWTYLWWLEHEELDPRECLVLVSLTNANRQTFYNPNHVSYANDPPWNKFVHDSWVHSGFNNLSNEWLQMIKLHTVLTSCPELFSLYWQQALHFFDGQSSVHGNNLVQFCGGGPAVTPSRVASLLWPDQCLTHALWQQFGQEHFKPGGHPSESGHEKIRDWLINEIDPVILA